MKIRTDFVTNSSSSSYVISYQSCPSVDEETLTKYPFIKTYQTMIDRMFGGSEIVKTVEQLDEYIIERYGWRDQTLQEVLEDDEYVMEKYNDYKEKIEKGFSIGFMSVEYGDEYVADMLNGLHDGINIIVECEG